MRSRRLLRRLLERFVCVEDDLGHALESLALLHRKVDLLMALVDDLKAGIAKLDAETTAIGGVIDGLVARLRDQSLTAEQRAEVLAGFDALAARLGSLGVDPTNPVPTPTAAFNKAKQLAGSP